MGKSTDPKKFDPLTGCDGKVRHRTFEAAEADMRHRGRHITRDGRGGVEKAAGKIVVYKCPIKEPYTHYHVGKNTADRRVKYGKHNRHDWETSV